MSFITKTFNSLSAEDKARVGVTGTRINTDGVLTQTEITS